MGNRTFEGMFSIGARTSDQPLPSEATYLGKGNYQLSEECKEILIERKKIIENLKSPTERGKMLDSGFYFLYNFEVEYRGEWKAGRPHGKGEVHFKEGGCFIGTFLQGIVNGTDCLWVTQEGAVYKGGFQNNQRNGLGYFQHHSYRYEGSWLNDLPHGFGKQIFPNGDIYRGKFKKGVKSDNNGIYQWKNHPKYLKYVGEFENNAITKEGNFQLQNFNKLKCSLDYSKHSALDISNEDREILIDITEKAYQKCKTHQQAQQIIIKQLKGLSWILYKQNNPIIFARQRVEIQICGKKLIFLKINKNNQSRI